MLLQLKHKFRNSFEVLESGFGIQYASSPGYRKFNREEIAIFILSATAYPAKLTTHPRKSPRTVNKIRQQLQVHANDAQQQAVNLKRRAVDAEQQVDATRKPRKKRRLGDRARGADDSEVNPEATEARVREQDPDFDLDHEYDSSVTERQGQLHDILEVLPDDVKPKISQTWVQDSFLDGLSGQRTSIRYRLRTEAIHHLVDDVKACATSASRFEKFSALIGHKPATGKSQAFYDRWAVPVLYDKWDGHVDLNGLFRGELPVKSGFGHRFEALDRVLDCPKAD
ncbi:hypothetical protein B0H13DRAFT_1867667 [Mycena leptocephala]|nr:hypothetical protein B0H13DRAFT_1867667 [Mycena leptocephala]